jgi:hypothetical protein
MLHDRKQQHSRRKVNKSQDSAIVTIQPRMLDRHNLTTYTINCSLYIYVQESRLRLEQ